MRRVVFALLATWVLVAPAWAQQTHNTVPGATASFITDLQTYLLNEDPNRFKEFFGGIYTISGGTHATGAGLTKTPAALLAYPGGYYATETGSIVYQDNTVCWVVATYTTTSSLTGNFVRVSGTKYAIDCVSAAQPTQPANSVYLMKVTTSGGAVTVVQDLRQFTPFVTPGSLTGLSSISLAATSNGITIFGEKRFTDSAPTGNFQDLQNAAGTSLWKIDITGALVAGTIATTSVGPHAIGGATQAGVGTRFTGTLAGSFQYGVNMDHTISPAAGAEAATLLVGGTINKAGSGTHNMFNGARFLVPTIGAGAAALTTVATVRIDGTPAVGTNKYGLYNVGNSRFDDGVGIGSGTTALGSGLIVGTVADKGAGTINVASGYYAGGTFALRGYIAGLGTSNDGVSPNTVIDTAAGITASDDATVLMALGTFTKSTGAWSLGSAGGCLDTGVVAINTWYHLFVIMRTDTGVVDQLCSTSLTPVMPGSYTKKRRISSFKTDGATNIIAYKQRGDFFEWVTPVSDVSNATPGTGANTGVLSTPLGVATRAFVNLQVCNTCFLYISSLAITDSAAGTGTGLGFGTLGGNTTQGQAQVTTNTASSIRYRSSVNAAVAILTLGWTDARGKDD